jgi:hypothetical protein
MGKRKYCLNDDQHVRPTKNFSILRWFFLSVVTLGLGLFLYPLWYVVKPGHCPKCHDRNWGHPSDTMEKDPSKRE